MNIAIFASGGGSNAEVIIKTLPQLLLDRNINDSKISLILTNNSKAGVLDVASQNNIPSTIISLKDKTTFEVNSDYLGILNEFSIDFIILAGYLKKIPPTITSTFPQKIVNIHPALLPAYGGAGMYGAHVHEAVIKAGEKQSGITIHYANEAYDEGAIIFQTTCTVEKEDTAKSLAKKVLDLEHGNYARVIADVISSQNVVK
jgi:phosphoribosylglycinamide formyltransferase 1